MCDILRGHPNKKTKYEHLQPIGFGFVRTSIMSSKGHKIHILFDTGATGSFIDAKYTKYLSVQESTKCMWNTGNGPIKSSKIVTTQVILPELYHK